MQQSFDSRSNSVGVQTSYLHLYCALNLLSSVKSDSPQLVLQLWKEEEVTRREIRRIGWMLNHLPVPGIKHVKQGSRDVHRRIVMQEDDAVLQQLSTLLSDGQSQHFTDDPLLVRSVARVPGGTAQLRRTPWTSKNMMCMTFKEVCFLIAFCGLGEPGERHSAD